MSSDVDNERTIDTDEEENDSPPRRFPLLPRRRPRENELVFVLLRFQLTREVQDDGIRTIIRIASFRMYAQRPGHGNEPSCSFLVVSKG